MLLPCYARKQPRCPVSFAPRDMHAGMCFLKESLPGECSSRLARFMCHAHSSRKLHAGVCFYQRESLPGYSAIFRHPNDELNFCYYLIPCGKDGMCGDVKASPATPAVASPIEPPSSPAHVLHGAMRKQHLCLSSLTYHAGVSLKRLQEDMLKKDPFISQALGLGAKFSICALILHPSMQESDLKRLHEDGLKKELSTFQALGPRTEQKFWYHC